jgi:hypothetical protein
MVVGLASLIGAAVGWSSYSLSTISLLEAWSCPCKILFYFPAGAILVVVGQVYRRAQIPNWLLGGMIGFAFYVSLHWLTDFMGALGMGGMLELLLAASHGAGELFWDPLRDSRLGSSGSIQRWIDMLGISWFTAIPFVGLGMLYASAYVSKNRWVLLLTVLLSLLFIGFCLFVFSMEILWGLMN